VKAKRGPGINLQSQLMRLDQITVDETTPLMTWLAQEYLTRADAWDVAEALGLER